MRPQGPIVFPFDISSSCERSNEKIGVTRIRIVIGSCFNIARRPSDVYKQSGEKRACTMGALLLEICEEARLGV